MADTVWTHADARRLFDQISERMGDWQGLPVMLGEDMPLVLADGHPLRDLYADLGQTGGMTIEIISGGIDDVTEDEEIVNEWFCRARNCRVLVIDRGGRRSALTVPVSPDRSMDRLTFWMQTMGAADAWDLDAEYRARETLRAMLTDRQWMHYDLTGAFFETSHRSRVSYVFRRLRPTIALSPRHKDGEDPNLPMRCLAVLCLHPTGYYQNTWAGCLVPSDDVIAHLAMVRGDEAFFWRKANQHRLSSPEAGL